MVFQLDGCWNRDVREQYFSSLFSAQNEMTNVLIFLPHSDYNWRFGYNQLSCNSEMRRGTVTLLNHSWGPHSPVFLTQKTMESHLECPGNSSEPWKWKGLAGWWFSDIFGEWWNSGYILYIYIIGTWQKIEPAKLVYHQIASLFRCWRGAACDMNGSQQQWGRFWVYHLDVSPPQMWEQRQDLRYNHQQE
jgi:hypothetical protein